ncbi:MAG: Gfo/Idh/MocA family oxidoreductase, partial [Actinomycetota bacterium]|nr:Gfo/Idh/MocA family oxidoreductase [Actinomycetota bacterium]
YGPGRYDPTYEEGGVDYPIGYVRWTERRNLECFLDLVDSRRIDLEPLVSAVVPFEEAVATYERIQAGEQDAIGFVFRYPAEPPLDRRLPGVAPVSYPARAAPSGRVRLGVIGAGSYATAMLLPHLREREDVELVEVATTTGLSATNAGRKFGFQRFSTDHHALLTDKGIDAVMIVTRHDSHARLVCEALRAGKAVFVEKPLAIDEPQLEAICTAVAETGNDRLMVGFNRRFAPLLVELRNEWGRRAGALQIRYDVNAGSLEPDSWYARSEEQGSRVVGEACHFVDTASWWLESDPLEVFAAATPQDSDDCVFTLIYPDGSLATISYLTRGDNRYPKEVLQVFGHGQVARLHNFRRAELWRGGRRRTNRARGGTDKGQSGQLQEFVRALLLGDPMPIPFASLVATTRATFAVRRSLVSRRLEKVAQAPGVDRQLQAAGRGVAE